MQAHQERVVQEQLELAAKLLKLEEFAKGEVFAGLDLGERNRLFRQRHHMTQYLLVLNERISAFYDQTTAGAVQ